MRLMPPLPCSLAATLLLAIALAPAPLPAANPFVTDIYTADPAAIVHGDAVYVYVGHDEAAPRSHYNLRRWLCYSSTDMKNWTSHGSPLSVKDFAWATRDAYAAHVAEKDGKFYWYVSIEHDSTKPGKAIGVAVSDSPTGPFKDARGSALITADMTPLGRHSWEDIDPAIFTYEDGASYIFWGNVNCYYAKLKPNMIELDGPIMVVELPWFTEAPWIHQRGGIYYMTYASYFPEKIAYATSSSIHGPWTYRGILAEVAGNSNTIHQAILEFKGQWYFFYHNGSLHGGDSHRRSVCVDYLYYNPDGTMRRVAQTTEGTTLPPAAPATPENVIVPSWTRLQSFSAPELFVRHLERRGALAASPISPFMDSMWAVRPGLADPQGVSFESHNFNFGNHYLRQQDNEVTLAQNDGSEEFKQSATFHQVPGLAGEGVSFRSAASPDHYLQRSGETLRIERITSEAARRDATFRLLEEGGQTAPPLAAAPAMPSRAKAAAAIALSRRGR
jgi:hypothetical protein